MLSVHCALGRYKLSYTSSLISFVTMPSLAAALVCLVGGKGRSWGPLSDTLPLLGGAPSNWFQIPYLCE